MNKRGISKIAAVAASLVLAAATAVAGAGPAAGAELDPPTNLRVAELSTNKVTLAWDPPDGAVASYRVLARGPASYYNQSATVEEPTATLHLTQGKTYEAQVWAEGADGRFSDGSDLLTFTMPVDPDDPAVTTPANVTAEVDPDTLGIVVDWEPSVSEAGGVKYSVQVTRPGSTRPITTLGTRTTETTTTLYISLGRTYNIRVRASDAANRSSSFSESVQVTTPNADPPSTPENVQVTTSPGGATVTWDPPTSGAGVEEYWLTFRDPSSWKRERRRTTDTTATYTHLPGGTREVTVEAHDWYGRSSSTTHPVTFTFGQAEDWEPPSAPANFRATATPFDVLFEWDEPANGLQPFKYFINLDGSAVEIVYGDLQLHTDYFFDCSRHGTVPATFTVTAVSFGVESPPSNPVQLCF